MKNMTAHLSSGSLFLSRNGWANACADTQGTDDVVDAVVVKPRMLPGEACILRH